MTKYYYERWRYGKRWDYNYKNGILEETWVYKNDIKTSAFSDQFVDVGDLYKIVKQPYIEYPRIYKGNFYTSYTGRASLLYSANSKNTNYELYWTNENDVTNVSSYFRGTSKSYDVNTNKMRMIDVYKYDITLYAAQKIYAYYVPTQLNTTIIAEDGEYPDNGYSNGYWYIKKGLVFPELKMKVNGVLKTSENGWVKVNGKLREIDKIWTKINGVLREV
ncbi:hypothetical protein [Clostridium tetani]|uniref:Uncharacterized protein n=1 Tax=Clostridium tetani TaxID=1513 RepID=A0ABY0EVZ9_CLOTA|nr:hypothetical protein [Clostridium tetani]RXI58993.1 hypothetical protein DP131_00545 [Clostridium tetani]